jgi:hypothetical protein
MATLSNITCTRVCISVLFSTRSRIERFELVREKKMGRRARTLAWEKDREPESERERLRERLRERDWRERAGERLRERLRERE